MDSVSSEASSRATAPPVIIVGGSLVGLSLAMFLGAQGVSCVVVERHVESSPHPRAVGFTPRTLEMFASAGLRGIPEVPASFRLRRVRAESLAGPRHDETDWTPKEVTAGRDEPPSPPSPHTGAAIAQDLLEPMLRDRARALGATLVLGSELERFEDDGEAVTTWIRDGAGALHTLRGSYLIACDGNRSAIRETLGVGRQGMGVLQVMRSVLFRADLERYQQGIGQFEIQQPGLEAFLTTYGDGRWVLMFKDDVERDEAALESAIQRAIGAPVPFEIVATGRWELTALIADELRKGRVFLAGDAAHTLPPTRGGYGANTGIADAYDLAWKLAAVLSNRSSPSLLDTYEQERLPIAWLRYRQTFARPDYARFSRSAASATTILDPVAIELGERYRSSILEDAGPDLPEARRPDEWRGQPGTRAPHRAVTRNGSPMSTLDLFGRDWVLLSTSRSLRDAARQMEARIGIAVTPIDPRESFGAEDGALVARDLGIEEGGASLIRPDGVVAWRTLDEGASVETLERALTRASAASHKQSTSVS